MAEGHCGRSQIWASVGAVVASMAVGQHRRPRRGRWPRLGPGPTMAPTFGVLFYLQLDHYVIIIFSSVERHQVYQQVLMSRAIACSVAWAVRSGILLKGGELVCAMRPGSAYMDGQGRGLAHSAVFFVEIGSMRPSGACQRRRHTGMPGCSRLSSCDETVIGDGVAAGGAFDWLPWAIPLPR